MRGGLRLCWDLSSVLLLLLAGWTGGAEAGCDARFELVAGKPGGTNLTFWGMT